jgi:hypothetical protein
LPVAQRIDCAGPEPRGDGLLDRRRSGEGGALPRRKTGTDRRVGGDRAHQSHAGQRQRYRHEHRDEQHDASLVCVSDACHAPRFHMTLRSGTTISYVR